MNSDFHHLPPVTRYYVLHIGGQIGNDTVSIHIPLRAIEKVPRRGYKRFHLFQRRLVRAAPVDSRVERRRLDEELALGGDALHPHRLRGVRAAGRL